MKKKVFSSFKEAQSQQESDAEMKKTEEIFHNEAVARLEEDRRRKLETVKLKTELAEAKRRKKYLNERKMYIQALSYDELMILWANRASHSMEPDELDLLVGIIRERLAVNHANLSHPSVCADCGMVGDNCTCHKA